jgi:hypothetical protein
MLMLMLGLVQSHLDTADDIVYMYVISNLGLSIPSIVHIHTPVKIETEATASKIVDLHRSVQWSSTTTSAATTAAARTVLQ